MSIASLTRGDHRRNWAGFLIDYILFTIGLTFAGMSTVLPAFAARLTANPILIGLVGALWQAGWLLPQIFAAHYLSTAQKKLPVIKFFGWIGRPVFLGLGIVLLLSGATGPALMLLLLYAATFYFSFTDSIAGVAWFDVLGKAFTHRERGRMIGVAQAAAGVCSIGAGAFIGWILESSGLGFPNNYALILILSSVCFVAALGGMYLIREPIEAVAAERQGMHEYLPGLLRLIRTDRTFLRVNASRLLVSMTALAAPLYAVFALKELGIAEGNIGLFAIAQTVGGALAGLVFGWIVDRAGSHVVIRVVGGVYFLAPCLVFAAGAVQPGAAQVGLMSAAFLLIGLGDGSFLLGYLNYVLEIAPSGQRPVYIGLTNTLAGVIVLFPFLGGMIADLGGYRLAFLAAAVGIAAGWFVGAGLPARSAHADAGNQAAG